MTVFKKAERKQAKLKLAITGPSGSGKTYSALLIATGLGAKIAVMDTENKSAALYSDKFAFDILEIDPPYTVQKYMEGIRAAESAGYDVLMIDSISHAWAGDGGLLSKKEALDNRGGNSFSNWATITKEQEQFKALLLNTNVHLICTMRSKQDYVLEMNDKGKTSPRKVGLAPIQRDGMEYEFTTVFDMAMDHNAAVSKDRTGLFDKQIFVPSEKTGQTLLAWLHAGKLEVAAPKQVVPEAMETLNLSLESEPTPADPFDDEPPPVAKPSTNFISEPQRKRLYAIAKSQGVSTEAIKEYLAKAHGLLSSLDIPRDKYEEICNWVQRLGQPVAK